MRVSLVLLPNRMVLLGGILSVVSAANTDADAVSGVIASDKTSDKMIFSNTQIKKTIVIPDLTSDPIKKNILIDNSTNLRLECELSSDSKTCNASWKHGNEKISSFLFSYNVSEDKCYTVYEFALAEASKTGIYTCIFSLSTEVTAEFSITVPAVHIKGGDKPLVSYYRDSVVMKCDSLKYNPMEWIWYKSNGSARVQLNTSTDSTKYIIETKHANETKLHVSDLNEDDNGVYIC
ncbi:hypothetical protein GDO86_002434, partial [Hymenochirus boettgeri]